MQTQPRRLSADARARATRRHKLRAARRARHGAAILLKIYAHCSDGQEDAANQRITDALDARDTQAEPGDEEDADSEKAS